MIARCERRSAHSFRFYGARGIRVCDRWRNDFAAFVSDMGPKPFPDWSLDRIDSKGNYQPENCRWTDPLTQGQNCSTTRPVVVDGTSYPSTAAAARAYNMAPAIVVRRIKAGIGIEEAIKRPHSRTPVTIAGKRYQSARAAAIAYGLKYRTVWMRVKRGWSIERAVVTPVD